MEDYNQRITRLNNLYVLYTHPERKYSHRDRECRAILGQLGLKQWQLDEISKLYFDQIDLRTYKKLRPDEKRLSLVLYALAVLHHNHTYPEYPAAKKWGPGKYYPGQQIEKPIRWDARNQLIPDLVTRSELFRKMEEDIGVSENELRRAIEKVRAKIPEYRNNLNPNRGAATGIA